MRTPRLAFTVLSVFLIAAAHGATTIQLTRVEYEAHVRAVWTAQIIAVLLAWPHEHQVASSVWLVCGRDGDVALVSARVGAEQNGRQRVLEGD